MVLLLLVWSSEKINTIVAKMRERILVTGAGACHDNHSPAINIVVAANPKIHTFSTL